MVSDVLLLSYLDKIGLSLTGEAGQASAYLYCEARLYKHCIPAEDLLPQRKLTRSWDEDKAYLTPEKYVHNFSKVWYYFLGVA